MASTSAAAAVEIRLEAWAACLVANEEAKDLPAAFPFRGQRKQNWPHNLDYAQDLVSNASLPVSAFDLPLRVNTTTSTIALELYLRRWLYWQREQQTRVRHRPVKERSSFGIELVALILISIARRLLFLASTCRGILYSLPPTSDGIRGVIYECIHPSTPSLTQNSNSN